MSLLQVLSIAGSALNAQSLRLNLTASNLANADAISSSVGETYRSRHAVFAASLHDGNTQEALSGGVRVVGVVDSKAPPHREYLPDHPQADKNGYVYRPNVNVIEEMADMISASRSYQSNVEVINASKQMILRTLSIGQ
jgi:flagellar basal-body rod protein FlgC